MATEQNDESMVQLATRIPRRLHRGVKVHCVERDQSIQAFTQAALEERLRQQPPWSAPHPAAAGRVVR